MRRPEIQISWKQVKFGLWVLLFTSPFIIGALEKDEPSQKKPPSKMDTSGNLVQPVNLLGDGSNVDRLQNLVQQEDFTPEQKTLYLNRLIACREFLEETGHEQEYDAFLAWYLVKVGGVAIDILMDPGQPDLVFWWGLYQIDVGYRVGQPGY